MAKFKDSEKRSWSLKITVGSLKKVKDDTTIDLGYIASGKLENLEATLSNPFDLCAILYSLCEDQVEERNMTPEDFASMLHGDTFEAAIETFVESILDFYPRQKAQVLRAALAKEKEKQDKQLKEAIKELQD